MCWDIPNSIPTSYNQHKSSFFNGFIRDVKHHPGTLGAWDPGHPNCHLPDGEPRRRPWNTCKRRATSDGAPGLWRRETSGNPREIHGHFVRRCQGKYVAMRDLLGGICFFLIHHVSLFNGLWVERYFREHIILGVLVCFSGCVWFRNPQVRELEHSFLITLVIAHGNQSNPSCISQKIRDYALDSSSMARGFEIQIQHSAAIVWELHSLYKSWV